MELSFGSRDIRELCIVGTAGVLSESVFEALRDTLADLHAAPDLGALPFGVGILDAERGTVTVEVTSSYEIVGLAMRSRHHARSPGFANWEDAKRIRIDEIRPKGSK
jgi:hypothetical protein